MSAKQLPLVTHRGEPSFTLNVGDVSAFCTRDGGMLGPVRFGRGRATITPLSMPHWAGKRIDPSLPVLIRALRGDFFCLPFGGNEEAWRGESHPPHGETANATWSLVDRVTASDSAELQLQLKMQTRPGIVDKRVVLRRGHEVVYQQHRISGVGGSMPLGHHAMVATPAGPGIGLLATSAFARGNVLPLPFEDPTIGGYSSLKPGARIRTLSRVPLATGGHTDLTEWPARKGFDDLAMVVHQPAPFAWTTITYPQAGYVFFTLKDPAVLKNTILWMSNGGRHYAPWNGKHTGVMGIEDVTGYYHLGLAASSRKNALSEAGMPTTVKLSRKSPTVVNYLFGVVRTPADFGRVKSVEASADDQLTFTDEAGKSVAAMVDHQHLRRAWKDA